jgi:hypothetical protein
MNFRNKFIFYDDQLLAPRSTSKLEGQPLSAVRVCLFNIVAATLHTWRREMHIGYWWESQKERNH